MSEEEENTQHSHTLRQLLDAYWDAVTKRSAPVSTGIPCLDAALGGGFEPGRLIALLGGPGIGKTALANQIAEHVANRGRPVLYLSLEEQWHTMLQRLISQAGDLDYGTVVHRSADNRESVTHALDAIRKRSSFDQLRYIDQRVTFEELREEAQAHFACKDSGLLVIDYLQHWARYLRYQESIRRELRESVTVLAEQLRRLASDLNCTVLMLASQNRASDYGTEHTISSAKESGDIEYCCDVVMALDRVASKGTIQAKPGWELRRLDIAKNRLGSIGIHPLEWCGNRQQIRDSKSSEIQTPNTDELALRRNRRKTKGAGMRSSGTTPKSANRRMPRSAGNSK